MPNPWRQILSELGDHVDVTLLPRLYDRASLDTHSLRQELDLQGIRRVDPDEPQLAPTPAELEDSAQQVVASAGRRATLRGGLAGAAGLLAVPPEAALALVQLLHLAQRLAVIYGHDPDTDAGRLLLLKALAEALDFKLPRQARLGMRVTELPQLLPQLRKQAAPTPSQGPQLPDVAHRGAWLARTLATRTAVTVAGRTARIVPGLGAGIAAWQARRAIREQGATMARVFARAWGGAPFARGPVEDAVEVS